MTAQAFLKPQLAVLVEEGWDVHLACSHGEGIDQLRQLSGVTVHAIPMKREPSLLQDLRSLGHWNRLIKELKPDIVVGSTPKAALLSMLASKRNQVPARVYHARGFRAEGLQGVKKIISLSAERVTAKSATVTLCDSQSLRASLQEARVIDLDQGVVIGAGSCCGVDTDYFRPPTESERNSARCNLGLNPSDFVIGFVGRITRDKGIGELIEAANAIGVSEQMVKVVLVGPEEQSRETFPPARYNNSILFTGAMSDVRSAYWAFDVFALPSYREGFPIAPLEAQACGLPLITTNATGCIDSQAPGNSLLTVPAQDPQALATIFEYSAQDAERRREMGARARNWVASHFASPDVLRDHLAFLKDQV